MTGWTLSNTVVGSTIHWRWQWAAFNPVTGIHRQWYKPHTRLRCDPMKDISHRPTTFLSLPDHYKRRKWTGDASTKKWQLSLSLNTANLKTHEVSKHRQTAPEFWSASDIVSSDYTCSISPGHPKASGLMLLLCRWKLNICVSETETTVFQTNWVTLWTVKIEGSIQEVLKIITDFSSCTDSIDRILKRKQLDWCRVLEIPRSV